MGTFRFIYCFYVLWTEFDSAAVCRYRKAEPFPLIRLPVYRPSTSKAESTSKWRSLVQNRTSHNFRTDPPELTETPPSPFRQFVIQIAAVITRRVHFVSCQLLDHVLCTTHSASYSVPDEIPGRPSHSRTTFVTESPENINTGLLELFRGIIPGFRWEVLSSFSVRTGFNGEALRGWTGCSRKVSSLEKAFKFQFVGAGRLRFSF